MLLEWGSVRLHLSVSNSSLVVVEAAYLGLGLSRTTFDVL